MIAETFERVEGQRVPQSLMHPRLYTLGNYMLAAYDVRWYGKNIDHIPKEVVIANGVDWVKRDGLYRLIKYEDEEPIYRICSNFNVFSVKEDFMVIDKEEVIENISKGRLLPTYPEFENPMLVGVDKKKISIEDMIEYCKYDLNPVENPVVNMLKNEARRRYNKN